MNAEGRIIISKYTYPALKRLRQIFMYESLSVCLRTVTF